MNRTDLEQRIVSVVREELDDRKVVISPEADLADIPGWDSVTMSAVMIALEREYGIEFQPEEIDRVTSVDSIVDMLGAKLALAPAP